MSDHNKIALVGGDTTRWVSPHHEQKANSDAQEDRLLTTDELELPEGQGPPSYASQQWIDYANRGKVQPKVYSDDPKYAYAQVYFNPVQASFGSQYPWRVEISFYDDPKQGEPNSTWQVGTFESLGDALTNISNTIRARQLWHCDIEVNSRGQGPAGVPAKRDGYQLEG